jgi:hypothetical protein
MDAYRPAHARLYRAASTSVRPRSVHFGRGDELRDAGARRRVRATLSHSARSAITGSILVARRAGNHDAHSVTSRRKIDSAT